MKKKKHFCEENWYLHIDRYLYIKLPAYYFFHHTKSLLPKVCQYHKPFSFTLGILVDSTCRKWGILWVHSVKTIMCREMQYLSLSSLSYHHLQRRGRLRNCDKILTEKIKWSNLIFLQDLIQRAKASFQKIKLKRKEAYFYNPSFFSNDGFNCHRLVSLLASWSG